MITSTERSTPPVLVITASSRSMWPAAGRQATLERRRAGWQATPERQGSAISVASALKSCDVRFGSARREPAWRGAGEN